MKNVSLAFLLLSACAEPVGAVVAEAAPTPTAADLEELRTVRSTPWLILVDVSLEDADGDYAWEAGEDAVLHATLVNTRGRDFMWYPGVEVKTDRPGLEVGPTWFYGIFGRTTQGVDLAVSGAGLSPGDVVTFTLSTTALGCGGSGPCPAADTTTFTAEVQ